MTDNHPGRRDVLCLAAGGVASLALRGAARAQASRGSPLRVSNKFNPSSLDPAVGNAGSDHVSLYTIYATLVEWDYTTLQARPGIAEAWHFPDPLTLVLKLRPGVLFHDGTPCDADAVKFNLERGVSLPRSSVKADLAAIDTIETRGADQVILHLKLPNTALPLMLSDRAGMMISPTAARANPEGFERKPVGAGPWKFVSWLDGARIVLARNDSYFKPRLPGVDTLEFTIIPELGTGLRSVIAGENDLAFRLEPPQKTVAERSKGIVLVTGPTLYVHQFYFNLARPPFDNLKVRQAMNYAVDRAGLNQATMLGLGEVATTALPRAHWAHDTALDAAYPHDPAKARRLLTEAGLPNGLDVKVSGYADQTSQQRQEVLIEQFAKSGIRLQFNRVPIAQGSTNFFGPEKRNDCTLSAWTGRPDPSLTYSLMFSQEGYFNTGHVQLVTEMPAALAAAQATDDIDQRREAFARVQKLVVENALFLPLLFDPEIDVHAPRVKDYRPNLLGKPKFEEVTLT
jgi:ABC-type transport system substrate-binding protein